MSEFKRSGGLEPVDPPPATDGTLPLPTAPPDTESPPAPEGSAAESTGVLSRLGVKIEGETKECRLQERFLRDQGCSELSRWV